LSPRYFAALTLDRLQARLPDDFGSSFFAFSPLLLIRHPGCRSLIVSEAGRFFQTILGRIHDQVPFVVIFIGDVNGIEGDGNVFLAAPKNPPTQAASVARHSNVLKHGRGMQPPRLALEITKHAAGNMFQQGGTIV
jgi:hypothetical protein